MSKEIYTHVLVDRRDNKPCTELCAETSEESFQQLIDHVTLDGHMEYQCTLWTDGKTSKIHFWWGALQEALAEEPHSRFSRSEYYHQVRL